MYHLNDARGKKKEETHEAIGRPTAVANHITTQPNNNGVVVDEPKRILYIAPIAGSSVCRHASVYIKQKCVGGKETSEPVGFPHTKKGKEGEEDENKKNQI